jgi:hypothetical protein
MAAPLIICFEVFITFDARRLSNSEIDLPNLLIFKDANVLGVFVESW